ncbi:MAG: type 1 glutamine amidotransferase [Acidimicrobiales bacterium]
MRPLRIVVVYPDLLGTYGDGGNGVVLERRALRRGIDARLVQVTSDQALPGADLYTLGGGEDAPQVLARDRLADDGALWRGASQGAVVLAVCAGYQIAGRSFCTSDGAPSEGLGLLDVVTTRSSGPRAVGEILVQDTPAHLGALTGFENHAGLSSVGQSAQPLGKVSVGTGNGDGTEGARSGRVVGTYLHGPVLARNPALADLLLCWATGAESLDPLDDHLEEALREERLSASTRRSHRRRP